MNCMERWRGIGALEYAIDGNASKQRGNYQGKKADKKLLKMVKMVPT